MLTNDERATLLAAREIADKCVVGDMAASMAKWAITNLLNRIDLEEKLRQEASEG